VDEVGKVDSKTAPEATSEGALPDLGSPTSTRSWVALLAVILLLAAAGIWGYLGSVSVLTQVPAVAAGGGLIYEITAPTDGTIASIVSPGVVIPEGAPVATIDPIGAGLAVPVNQNDVVLVSSWNVVLGSPVTKGQVIARGAIFNMQPKTAGVDAAEPLAGLAFVSGDMADIIKSAPSLTLSAVGTSGQVLTAPVVLLSVGAFPVSESRVALMTGNPYFALNLMKSDRGNTFEVYLGYANIDDYNKVEESVKEGMTPIVVSGAQATLTITEVKTNPLSFLFGSNG